MAGEVFSSASSPQIAVDRRPQNLNAPHPVTQYYGVKQGLYTAKSWDHIHAICAEHGLDTSHLSKDRLPGEFERKGLVAQYFESHFEQAQTPQEHFKRLLKVTNNVRDHLAEHQADAALVVSGSYARGKNGTRSDLDFTLILEKAGSEQDVQRE
ncbi:MAG TPA: nucleotidyltransferase domain-containing protein, partial [Patescibacteria group bacterium]|nr:nucleotidyltransferase domain-containing protein [Patescibacteria group bacterium]